MVLDDSEWFAAQKRIREEMATEYDEPVISEYERMVRDDIIAWANQNGMATYTLKAQAAAYWNERLN